IKLLHVTSSLKIGGAEAVLCDLIKGLGAKQFEHTVIYFHDGPRVECLKRLGVRLFCLKGFFCLYDPIFLIRLFLCIKKINPDVIHSLLWSANVASRLVAAILFVPHVSVYHNNIDQDGLLRNFLDKVTRRFSKKIIAVSDEVAYSIKKTDKKLQSDRLEVIKNGIDALGVRKKVKQQAIFRSDLGLDKNHFVIGSVGRFCVVKNYPLLLVSFARLYKKYKKVRLVLCGVGPEEQNLKVLAQKLDIASEVLFIVGKSAYGYFSLFDCFVQSSDKEGISIALLEAMSCSISCVVTNVEKKHPVITTEKNGIIVDAGDEVALVNMLEGIYLNSKRRGFLGLSAKKHVEQFFSLQSMIQRYKKLFCAIQ
ncbi:glycosyltransferase, partial [bacterium]|nr:glycosyltransferase [bacterium]